MFAHEISEYYQKLIDDGMSHKDALTKITKEASSPPKENYEKTLDKLVRTEWTNERANNTDLQTMLSSIFKAVMMPIHERITDLEHNLTRLEDEIHQHHNDLEQLFIKCKELDNGTDGRLSKPKRNARTSNENRNDRS